MRKLLCGLCPHVWNTYGASCVEKPLKSVQECGDVDERFQEKDVEEVISANVEEVISANAQVLIRANKCIQERSQQLSSECQLAVGSKRKGRSTHDSYGESDLHDMLMGGTFYDQESDAPIGWRTIQGEWFQELRARSAP
ncbi:hypothetical protein MTO96_022864 [Rhipicephalus appendiculatus]